MSNILKTKTLSLEEVNHVTLLNQTLYEVTRGHFTSTKCFSHLNVCCRGDCDTSSPTCASRCHVCGFETDGRALFQSHMTEHRQWERGSFSLHCCVCDHSTNQEAEMRAHANTHMQGNMGAGAEMRWAHLTCVTDAGV